MDFFHPVQLFSNTVTSNWLGLSQESYLGNALNFFIYDTIKIGILLVLINYLVAVTRYYFPTNKVKDILTRRRWYGLDYFFAAILGVVTPFCSCSSIPLFIGFISAGIPLGVTFAFLIASPLVNESSLILFPALFGLKTTIIYNLVGILVAILGGMLMQKLRLEKYINPELLKYKSKVIVDSQEKGQKTKLKKLMFIWWADGIKITKSIFPFVVLGVGIGAIIHGYVPATLIEKYLSTSSWWAVPMATILGVPLYANSVSVIPVMEALVGKGIPLGTALSFMTATVTLSIPEALILKKAMGWPLLTTFFGITTIGIILIGYLFNFISP